MLPKILEEAGMATAAAAKKKVSAGRAGATKPGVDLPATFAALKNVLKPYEAKCSVESDTPKDYHLNTIKKIYKGQQVYFAGVKLNKNYVSFYLMTVYGSPKQKSAISPELNRRMQGKACFNFTSPDPQLIKELAALVKTGAKSFLDVDELDVAGMKCD
jgi:hypothetical protein